MKKKISAIILSLLLIVSCFTLAACKDDGKDYGTLTVADVTVSVGETADLVATFSKEEHKADITYTFEGNGISIENGKVTGIAEGVTTVTATTAHHSATFTVTVTAVDYGKIVVDAPSVIYLNYAGKPVTATFSKPDYAENITYTLTNKSTFESKDVTVKIENGVISATGNMSVTMTAKFVASTSIPSQSCEFKVKIQRYDGAGYNGASLNFETRIAQFESKNQVASGVVGGEKGGTLFVGDSFFDGFWGNFDATFSGKNAYRYGVSSSTLEDWLIVSERIVYPYEPKNIVVHCGTNDIHDDKKSAQATFDMSKQLVDQYHANLPYAKVYWFSIEPRRTSGTSNVPRDTWATCKAANELMKAYAEDNSDWLVYIDSAAWCFTDSTETTINTSFYRASDATHVAESSYVTYVNALVNAGMVIENTGCGGSGKEPIDYGTLTIDDITLNQGANVNVAAVFSKPTYAENIEYSFDGENIRIENGKVYGLVGGTTTTVTATTAHHSATFTVTVTAVNYGTLTIANVTMNANENKSTTPIFSVPAMAQEIQYTIISGGGNVTINENGVITAITAGTTTTVRATTEYHSTTFTVTVNPVINIVEIPEFIYINHPGKSYTFTVASGFDVSDVSVSVSFDVSGATFTAADGKLSASGVLGAAANGVEYIEESATITFDHQYQTITKIVKVRQYDGKNSSGNSLNLNAKGTTLLNNANELWGENGTLFVGDSFFDTGSFWTNFYSESYYRKNAVSVGISSSTVSDWLVISDRLVYPFNPANIVLHLSTNDIHDDGLTATSAETLFKQLLNEYHSKLPSTKIYFFSVEPRRVSGTSDQPRTTWPNCKAFNASMKTFAEANSTWLTYIDSAAWCFTDTTETTIKTSFYKDGDATHVAVGSYATYVEALENAGLTVGASQVQQNTTIADIVNEMSTSLVAQEIMYRGLPLTTEYVLTGATEITETSSNAHYQFAFNGANNRFLLWDSNSDKTFGLGYCANGEYANETTATNTFVYTEGTTYTVYWKLIVTAKNAYFYFGVPNDSTIDYTLEAVFYNVPVRQNMKLGAQAMVTRSYDMVAKTKLDDAAEYDALIAAANITDYENLAISTNLGDGLYTANVTTDSNIGTPVRVVRGTALSSETQYIDVRNTFDISGRGSNNSSYVGTRDWAIFNDGEFRFTSNFAISYDFNILTAAKELANDTNSVVNSAFHLITLSTNKFKSNAWNEVHFFMQCANSNSVGSTSLKAFKNFDSTDNEQTGLTATKYRVVIVKNGVKAYVAMAPYLGETLGSWTVSTKTYSSAPTLSVWLCTENINVRVSNFTFETSVTSALTEIGKNA